MHSGICLKQVLSLERKSLFSGARLLDHIRCYRKGRVVGDVRQTGTGNSLKGRERDTKAGQIEAENVARAERNIEFAGRSSEQVEGGEDISSAMKELQNMPLPSEFSPEFVSDADSFESKLKAQDQIQRDQSRHSFRPKINPKSTSLLLFPGQGSHFVGMGKKLLEYPNVERMYSVASKILGYDLLEVCVNGPKQTLDKTVCCQPAVMVTSLAAVEKLKHVDPWAIENCISAAGYSVGEFAALVFAGAMSFEDDPKPRYDSLAMQRNSTAQKSCRWQIRSVTFPTTSIPAVKS